MGNFGRLIMINIIVIIVLIGGGALGYYYYNQSTNYVTTDNAKVDGQTIPIAAPSSGKLTDWTAKLGAKYQSGDTLGKVQTMGSNGKPATMPIQMPKDGTLVQNNGVTDTFIGAGIPIATAYNLDKLYITANIKETNIDNIKTGQKVDISVDAYPNAKLTGRIDQIGMATQSTFSLMPSQNNSGNYTKVTQVVPVKISIDSYQGTELMPGMNVTVKIHI